MEKKKRDKQASGQGGLRPSVPNAQQNETRDRGEGRRRNNGERKKDGGHDQDGDQVAKTQEVAGRRRKELENDGDD